MLIKPTDAFLVIDVQNDFVCGTMSEQTYEHIIPPINRLAKMFDHVITVADWHPEDHVSFTSTHPGTKMWDEVPTYYGQQQVYERHCVQGSYGAELHPALELDKAELAFRKGYRSCSNSRSAFYEADGTGTGLSAYLRARQFERLFMCGLGRYGCVLQSAFGAARDGFKVHIVYDASDGDLDVEENDRLMADAGISFVYSDDLAIA